MVSQKVSVKAKEYAARIFKKTILIIKYPNIIHIITLFMKNSFSN